MSVSGTGLHLGRHVFGVAALVFGLITLVWHNYNGWQLPVYVVYLAAAAEICGGVALQFPGTAKAGAIVLSAIYLAFAIACVPRIVVKPQIYNNWGNFFEQLSLVSGAAIVYAQLSSSWSREIVCRMGRIRLGLCSASFALEQAFYLAATVGLVPKWLPPNAMFWAVATTILFALAAVALLTNRMALLATRLLTLMLVLFGLLVWVPALVADSRNAGNWGEFAETIAIAGTAWILADLLGEDASASDVASAMK